MQLPGKVEILGSVIPAISFTCLMMDAKIIRHLKSLIASEKSGISYTFYIQKHAQNANNATVMQTGWNGCQNHCPYDVLGGTNEAMGKRALITEAVSWMLTK